MIDLHSHTNRSDGSLSPKELIDLALGIRLKALAITDHDTFDGYEEALPLAERQGLDLLRGIELNSRVEMAETAEGPPKSAHILVYFPAKSPSEEFLEWLGETRRERRERNQKLIQSLQANGVDITLEEVEAKGRSLTARPHFAKVLVEKGYAQSTQDAFDRYLGEEAASYVYRDSPTTLATIVIAREGNGIPVIAHPVRLGLNRQSEQKFLSGAKDAGLLGLEVFHSEHSYELQRHYLKLAEDLELLTTGGSDYHGPSVKPDIELGTGRNGNVHVPLSFLNRLRETAAKL